MNKPEKKMAAKLAPSESFADSLKKMSYEDYLDEEQKLDEEYQNEFKK